MKTSLLFAIIGATTLSGAALAQSGSIPAPAKATLAKLYPAATGVKWDKEDGNFEASFKNAGKSMSLLIAANGMLKETETDIAISELPVAVRSYVAKEMPGKKIKEAATIVDASGTKKYEAEVGGKDLLFDMAGHPIK